MEMITRSLVSKPSEVVDIKQKILSALGVNYPKIGDPQFEKKLMRYNEIWQNINPYEIIQIDSVRHEIGLVQNVLRRVVIDFTIMSDGLANLISHGLLHTCHHYLD